MYDGAGNKTSQTDARGNATTYKPDALNRVESTQDPEGGRTAATYDLVGNVLTETDKRGTVTEHTYDTLNRRTSTRKAGIELEALSYTAIGKVASRTDANGNKTTYTYDRRGLQTGTSAPEGATTAQVLDGMGDTTQHTDAEGRVTRTAYDVRRRQVEVTNPAGEVTKTEYDRNNNRTATVRPSGGRTVFAYDSRNWLESVTEPMGRTSRYTRDANGNLTGFTDGANRSIVFDHDKMNRRTTVTYAGGATQSNVYDVAGNVVQHIDANGVSVGRVFDKLNRERSKTYSASSDGLTGIETAYDPNGNVLTVTEKYTAGSGADNRTTTKTYDAFDRELTVQDGFGAQIAYTYDPNGNRKTLATQDAKVTRYGYDGLNRLTGLGSAAGSTQYLYDRSGLVREQVNGNGTTTATTYDAATRPKRITLSKGSVPLNLTEYTYDPNGNRTQERVNRPGGAQVTSYGYDAADRLTSTKRVDGANTVDSSWTYDGADNRLSETVVSTGAGAGTVTRGYTYDARNQLREIADSVAGITTLSYDPQGNLQQKVKGNDTTAYVWSARDLLASVSRNGTLLGRYGSDHAGLRVQKEALDPLQPGAPPRGWRTQWDDENAVQDRDMGGTVIARYDFAGGQPVAMWSAEDGNQVLHADALGSVVATTSADGSVKSETLYDAWGNPVVKAGASANKFAYTGHQADAETGLYYFKARYYDPETGRFISVDPAEGQDGKPASYHKYLYAYGNPLVYVDPDGRATCVRGDYRDFCRVERTEEQRDSDRRADLREAMAAAKKRDSQKSGPGANWDPNRKSEEITSERREGPGVDQSDEERQYRRDSGADSALASGARAIGKGSAGTADLIEKVACFENGLCMVNVGGLVRNGVARGEVVVVMERLRAFQAERAAGAAARAEAKAAGAEARLAERAEAKAASSEARAAERAEANAGQRAERQLCNCCFAAGTPILTEGGLTPIEQLKVGDLVQSRNPVSGETNLKPITHLILTPSKPLYRLTLRGVDGVSTETDVTDNHPYWVDSRGWVDSARLEPGMKVPSFDKGLLTVEAVKELGRIEATYNFTVADFHTYFAGPAAAFVHNQCTCSDNAAELAKNMAREGRAKAKGEAAAHIVASGGSQKQWEAAARSRQLLDKYRIGVNDAANGVPLGHPRPHNVTHTRQFHEAVESRLNNVEKAMQEKGYGSSATRDALRREMREIGREVLNGNFKSGK